MKSLYHRQLAMTVTLVLISFLLLGTAFIGISYQYNLRDKEALLERNASTIANFTAILRTQTSTALSDPGYQSYVSSLASISEAYVIITENSGQVVFSADGEWNGTGNLSGYMPTSIVASVTDLGSYTGVSDLGGLFSQNRLVSGTPIIITNSTTGESYQLGIVFTAAEISNLTDLWRATATIFFFAAVVVLCITFVACSITSHRQTKPLNDIANAAHRFGHGELGVRVYGYENRRDEAHMLAEAFNNMADSLAQSEAKRIEFVANVSHELKTPMTTIAGFSDGILDGTIPPEREREALQTISSETRRLSRLVRRMLDLSRLQSAETVTTQETFDISELLLRVLVSLENKINARTLDVDANLPRDPVMVWGDPDAITQVCYNLLDNAIKFSTPESSIGVSIAAKNGKAIIAISNHGETLRPEELPLLFDRFHKTDRSRSEDREGVGLGLHIVKTILDNHQEPITVTSVEGLTEFSFTLTCA